MYSFTHASADDPLFGSIGIELDHESGALVVNGGGLPRVEMTRAVGTPLESHVPIGTRDRQCLVMTVDGTAVTLRPAKGFLTRRSYRVDAESEETGSRHRLVPDSLGSSRLLRDGVLIGTLTSTGDGVVTADWESDIGPEPRDAAIGYALAAAFGTGAEPMWKLTLEALLNMWP